MKRSIFLLFFSFHLVAYSQQKVQFQINVTLDPKYHNLDGFEKIEYTNNSSDTLPFIWMHLWPNAYKNDKTAYSEQLLAYDRTDFYFSSKEKKGYINRLDFKVNGITAKMEDHPKYIDIIKLILPKPLAPKETAIITTPFHVQIPYNFSGNGRTKKSYQLVEWYPKPALYNANGWHPMPYLYKGELYSEPGDYDINITVPQEYNVTADKGELQDTQQIADNILLHYRQDNLQNFTWFANKNSITIPKIAVPNDEEIRRNELVKKFFDTTKKKAFSFLPAVGYNMYDGFMIGGLIHNYLSPQNHFRIIAIPLYGTSSKKLVGLARASYSWYPNHLFHRIDAGAAVARFSYNSTIDGVQLKKFSGFTKIVPFIRATFKKENELSKINKFIQLKHFYFKEEGFRYKEVINGADTSLAASVQSENRNITQLKLAIENNRKLYPYSAELSLENHKYFIRVGFTGKYYFNYANDKNGLHVRLFAGKIFYTSTKDSYKQFITTRYHLNLSAPNGYEDYTYSNYFIGRNEFEGTAYHQIMIRDGSFKVNTDLLSDKIGRTDNWLSAANFTTGLPDNINPLSVLPIKIPIKLFADIGTYAEAWNKNADNPRFLFDAGFQISLFNEILNIYFPILYSSVFRDYFKSYYGDKRFWKTVNFSIDIQNLNLGKKFPRLNL